MDNIVAVTFAIAGVLALPLRSDAVSRKILTPPPSVPCSALYAGYGAFQRILYNDASALIGNDASFVLYNDKKEEIRK